MVEGKKRLLVASRVNRFIPNPTWDPISKPGALDEYSRGRNPKGADSRELFGDLDRLSDHPNARTGMPVCLDGSPINGTGRRCSSEQLLWTVTQSLRV